MIGFKNPMVAGVAPIELSNMAFKIDGQGRAIFS
jgi:hypothetical protein